jgi:hypothetical protein
MTGLAESSLLGFSSGAPDWPCHWSNTQYLATA